MQIPKSTIHRPSRADREARNSACDGSVPHALAEVRRSSMTAASKKLTTVTTCAWARTALHPLPHHPRHPTTYDLTAHCNVFPFPLHALRQPVFSRRSARHRLPGPHKLSMSEARHCSHFSFPRKETLTSHFTSSLRHMTHGVDSPGVPSARTLSTAMRRTCLCARDLIRAAGTPFFSNTRHVSSRSKRSAHMV